MDQRDRLPQIELAVGDDVTALVLRHLEPLSAADAQRLRDFAAAHGVQWWLQPKGPETAHRLDAGGTVLRLRAARVRHHDAVPADRLHPGQPAHQPRAGRRARCACWRRSRDERVIDWFCGLGNFTLPLATRAREVLGIEGSETLVARARDNAARQRPGRARTPSRRATCSRSTPADLRGARRRRRWLIDPPREGAFALVKAWPNCTSAAGWTPPRRIVYVSCNPATLARDAGLLVHQAGYRCRPAGVVNMFPHTAHVESMAVFDRAAGIEKGARRPRCMRSQSRDAISRCCRRRCPAAPADCWNTLYRLRYTPSVAVM